MEPADGGEPAEPPLIEPAQLARWITHQNDDVVVVNKPGWVVCHPSKRGPWSSLVGALREHLHAETLHLVTRLDRETSGVVVVARHALTARRLQMAMQNRRVEKVYLAVLDGELSGEITVDAPIVRDECSPIAVKHRVAAAAETGVPEARSRFIPLVTKNGATIARVIPETGRTHQIRIHAAHLGHPVLGDKLYGPDESLYLDFARRGWTARHAELLPLKRQALHAARLRFMDEELGNYTAPPPDDLAEFVQSRLGLNLPEVWESDPRHIN